jgi:soluble lytic murein transglycosylase-like protein
MYSYIDEEGTATFTNLRPERRGYRVVVADPVTSPESPADVSGRHDYDGLIAQHAKTFDIDPLLVKAVIMVESGGNPRAVSRKGAQGLMQIMPSTARRLTLEHPFDPNENIAAGTRYLRLLYDRFTGNLDLVLAAYNAGPEKVVGNNMSVPLITETIRYVKMVKDRYVQFLGLRS